MCGAVIMSGGLFLIIMNIYHYHMLEKEKAEHNGAPSQDVENQDGVSLSEAQRESTTQTNGDPQDPSPDDSEPDVTDHF